MLKQSICLYNLGYYNELIPLLTTIINDDPYNFEAYYFRGLGYKEVNQHKNAINDLTEYILLDPENEETLLSLLDKVEPYWNS